MKVMNWFNWQKGPHLKVYPGIGNKNELRIWGHLLASRARLRASLRNNYFINALEMLKRYLLKPLPNAVVSLDHPRIKASARSKKDGYFELSIKGHGLSEGMHTLQLRVDGYESEFTAEVFIMDNPGELVISDIDDTFIVSHSTSFFKQLYLLLTKNPTKRKPFEGVLKFFNNLRISHPDHYPFIYISSSEWNLYDFIKSFCEHYDIPKGVFMLSAIHPGIWKLLRSGKTDHSHKLEKIRLLFNLFPNTTFTLVGDSGQKDPFIYRELALAYPDKVSKIYIRDIKPKRRKTIEKMQEQLAEHNIDMKLFGKEP